MAQENKLPEDKKPSAWNIKPYLAIGLTTLIVIMCSMVFFFFVYRFRGASELLGLIISVLQPIVFGVSIAYILNPLVNRYRNFLQKYTGMKKKTAKALAIAGALITAVILLFLFFWMVIPQVYYSIEELVIKMPRQVSATVAWIQDFWDSNEELSASLGGSLTALASYVESFLQTEILPYARQLVTQITTGLFVMAKSLLNIIIGIIVSIYVLMEKEHFICIAKKMICALFPVKAGNVVVVTIRKTHEIFSGFIVGKIIDSIIIGILTFIVLSIVDMPYTVLVSVIVGVTNVIPFFGPYIGAIPSFLLILIEDPIKSLWFLVIILIIQQLDGNIIGPKILGNSTGLSSFWVITSILLGGGLFGVVGMLIGVPTFAVIYYIVNEIVKHFLRKKGLPEESDAYLRVEKRDEKTGMLCFYPQKKPVENPEEQEEKKN